MVKRSSARRPITKGIYHMKSALKLQLLATSLLTVIAVPALAQAPAPAAAADESEAIVVTGSRIARPNETSNSPIKVDRKSVV